MRSAVKRARLTLCAIAAVVTHSRPALRDVSLGTGSPVVAARQAPPDRNTCPRPPVAHADAVLALQIGGRARVELGGEWTVSAGDVWLVPAGARHRMMELRQAEYWGLSLSVPCFAGDASALLLEPFERVRDGASPVIRIPAARQGYLEGLFVELERSGREPSAAGDVRAAVQRSLLTLILAEVGAARTSVPLPGASREVVTDSLRFIERNCLGPLTLNEVAAAVGRSPAYVTTALTRATGRSAVAWIVSGRMAEARRLLLHSGDRIEEVAARVGYADVTHFIRMFRREHGVTPASWRAQQLRAEQLRSLR